MRLDGWSEGMARRWRLGRDPAPAWPFGVALGLFLWGVMAALVTTGGEPQLLFQPDAALTHVRLLVAIPLLFLAESLFDPELRAFLAYLQKTGLVAEADQPRLAAAARRATSLARSRALAAACLIAAVAFVFVSPDRLLAGHLGGAGPTFVLGGQGPATAWEEDVCLPIVRFLLFRWLARLLIWASLLLKIARLPLRLQPTHSDGSGGIGYVVIVQYQLLPLLAALSSLQAAALVKAVMRPGWAMKDAIGPLLAVMTLDALLFVAPLLVFTPGLWRAKLRGLATYMTFASGYVSAFERRWIGPGDGSGEPLLGTGDIQSLADLTNSVRVVQDIRLVPVTRNFLMSAAVFAVGPFLPLALLIYPVETLVARLLGALVGG